MNNVLGQVFLISCPLFLWWRRCEKCKEWKRGLHLSSTSESVKQTIKVCSWCRELLSQISMWKFRPIVKMTKRLFVLSKRLVFMFLVPRCVSIWPRFCSNNNNLVAKTKLCALGEGDLGFKISTWDSTGAIFESPHHRLWARVVK